IATMDTNNSIEAGFIGMIGPLFDTLILCTMTGLIILASGAYNTDTQSMLTGAQLTQKAFELGFTSFGQNSAFLATILVGVSLILFAYTTILTWSYYGDRCVSFLFGDQYILAYRIILLIILVLGSVLNLKVVWDIADIANIGIAIPNLISLILLRKKVAELLREYVKDRLER
ncbi:MAG: alanine:cation symporter family protein, partial [Gammaproteobacteria bacterium]|nr:alanine:cation symporter family protein [Gammaproteobacteria bacterium]